MPWCDVEFYDGRGWAPGRYIQALYEKRRVYGNRVICRGDENRNRRGGDKAAAMCPPTGRSGLPKLMRLGDAVRQIASRQGLNRVHGSRAHKGLVPVAVPADPRPAGT